jgi:hypothetical protein
MRSTTRAALGATLVVAATGIGGPAVARASDGIAAGGYTVSGDLATFPVHHGHTTDGRPFTYVVIEASDSGTAQRFGVRVAAKLQNAAGTGAVQPGSLDAAGELVTPGSVDFSPVRALPDSPGSVGVDGYSPLVQLPDGAVVNAPVVADDSGRHDKVTALDEHSVTLRLTHGFARTEAVRYLSTDASVPGVAALEDATYAEPLGEAPGQGDDSTHSSRAALAAVVNGPTGRDNPQRQGIDSALLGEGDPLNVLAWLPGQGRYSPLWDVHLTEWTPAATAVRLTQFSDVEALAQQRLVTGPGGIPWQASGPVVDCPILALG